MKLTWRKQAMWILLAGLAAGAVTQPEALGAGFKTAKPYAAEGVRTLPIRPDLAVDPGMPTGPRAERVNTPPDWGRAPAAANALAKAYYQLNLGGAEPALLRVQLLSNSPCIAGKREPLMVQAHIEQCSVSLALDLNGNHAFEAAEMRTVNPAQADKRPTPYGAAPRRFTAEYELGTRGAQGATSASVETRLIVNTMLAGDANMAMRGGFGGPMGMGDTDDALERMLSVQTQVTPALSVFLDELGSTNKLVLATSLAGDGSLLPIGYFQGDRNQPYMSNPYMYGYGNFSGQPVPALDTPVRVGDSTWMIVEVAPDLRSMKVAPTIDSAKDNALAVGSRMPAWTRTDVLTRHLYTPADFAGKYVVVCAGGNGNYQSKYINYLQQATALRQAVGDGVRVIFIDDNVQLENLMQQLSGQEQPGFGLVVDRDYADNSAATLGSILHIEVNSGGGIVIGPDGKILLKTPGKVAEVLAQAQTVLPAKGAAKPARSKPRSAE